MPCEFLRETCLPDGRAWSIPSLMEILYILIPVSLVLLGVALWGFFWAVRSGQFDDLDSPATRILMEEDEQRHPRRGEADGDDRDA